MVLFYDPRDEKELARIEQLLREAGVEYSVSDEPEPRLGSRQVHVAEEDFPTAEALLRNDLAGQGETSSTVLPRSTGH